MKIITAVALFALMLTSCVTKEQNYAIIKGQFEGETTDREIQLCKVEHGSTKKVAASTIGTDGRFGFVYSVDEPGIYVLQVIGEQSQRKVKKEHNLKRMFLEDGVELDVNISDGTYELLASNSSQNNCLAQWNAKVDTVFSYSHGFLYNVLDFTSFFPVLPEFVSTADAFKATINTGDKHFDDLMTLMVNTDMYLSALQFIYTPRVKHPERNNYPEYYDLILNEGAPKDERLLELPNGADYLRLYTMYAVTFMPEKPARDKWDLACAGFIPNDLLKGYYAISCLNKYRSYGADYLTFKKGVEPYMKTTYLKETMKDYEINIRQFEEGAEAFDFAGTDINGKEHKLSDFRGQLVYVDVWATWCGPCKAQIPALKELEKQFHGQPVEFLSISVDKPKDKQKWIDFVKENELKGIQLMADKAFESDVAKAYRINAIPRFMLFNKDGKIISIDAPRPTDKTINEWLKKYL